MPVSVWQDVVNEHFPGSAWLRCSRETLDELSAFKATHALPTWDATLRRCWPPRGSPARGLASASAAAPGGSRAGGQP